ncbi:hypothetical protein KY345_00365 [Candidatus Woesearchaeota archaeon]|nr:hypothetical protein [Candidatus Woesearchaeota archaeon]
MDFIWIFLPVILALGIITSYEDIKLGKIRNKWIIAAIMISIIIHIILFLINQINLSYIIKISLFTSFSLIMGFFLYLMKLWSAGDAKLFTAYISLYPITFYNFVTTSFWPLAILVNTILPIFIFLLFQSLFKLKKEQFLFIIRKMFNPKRLAMYLLIIFSISWIVTMIFSYFNIQTNFLLNIIGIMAIMYVLRKVFTYELNYLLGLIAILRIFINYDYIMRLEFWKIFLLMTLTYALIIFFIKELGELYTKKANINYLKQGMQPVEFIIKHKGHYFRTKTMPKESELIYEQKPEGLTKEDIEKIQKLHRTGHLHFNTIRIQQTLPFAPFIFAGVLLSLLVKGNIIIWLRPLF